MKISDILDYMEQLAPTYMKMDWDNVGLLCGDREQEVTKILVALDPFEDSAREAKEIGAQLVLTHHPLIFHPCKSVTESDPVGRTLRYMIRNNISAINAHTNLDCAPGGVNDVLAEKLGLSQVSIIDPQGTDSEGREWGLLRKGQVESQSLESFLERVKKNLHCPALRYAEGGRPVHQVAVGGGACGSELMDAVRAGCDTFVTADLRYNQFWDARDAGLNIIDAGHFYTENPVCTMLQTAMQEKFPEITTVISKKHGDCMKFF